MQILAEIIFWSAFLALAHSYLFYPFLLYLLSRGKSPGKVFFTQPEDFPCVSVIMSVYNEEKVIQAKVESLCALDYPAGKLQILIGSDCSGDRTDELLAELAVDHPQIRFFPFRIRRGKPGVINELAGLACQTWPEGPNHLFLITDANVMLSPQALQHLAKHFRREKLAIADAHMVHTGMQEKGISRAENTYISSEVLIKYREGLLWGKMMGPFGGCYALRSNYFSPVPANYLVDDFYIAMRAFEKGGDAINELEALCFEAVSHEIKEEFRRKSRISAGNFQNMLTFRHLWWPPAYPLGFAFFSHKVLRWLGPFFLLAISASTALLALSGNLFYRTLFFILVVGGLGLPLMDYYFKILNINILPIRGLRYFIIMNAALLEGFIRFLKGIKSNVWEPPKRH